jgi:hypothetical protein
MVHFDKDPPEHIRRGHWWWDDRVGLAPTAWTGSAQPKAAFATLQKNQPEQPAKETRNDEVAKVKSY